MRIGDLAKLKSHRSEESLFFFPYHFFFLERLYGRGFVGLTPRGGQIHESPPVTPPQGNGKIIRKIASLREQAYFVFCCFFAVTLGRCYGRGSWI